MHGRRVMGKSLGEFEQMILFALMSLGDDAYGASIRREIVERTGREVSAGAVYTVLDRLEMRGLVASRVGEPTAERGGRRRKHYRIEASGAERPSSPAASTAPAVRALAPRTAESTLAWREAVAGSSSAMKTGET